MRRLPIASLASGRPVWLLEINVAGRIWRWASDPITVTHEREGKTYTYQTGIEPEFAEQFELLSESATLQAIPFELFWPESAAELSSRGFDFSAGTGELSLIFDGEDYETRRVLAKGSIDAPEIGYDDEPVNFSVKDNGYQDLGNMLSPTALVGPLTFNVSITDPASQGRYYPLILGSPGKITNAELTRTTGSPALGIVSSGSDLLVLAVGNTAASSVVLVNQTDDTTSTVAIVPITDALGQTVMIHTGATNYSHGDAMFARWTGDGGGVARGDDPNTAMDGAGEILIYALKKSTLTVDYAAFEAVSGVLNQYKIATYIDQPVAPWEWIQGSLLPILPISIVSGPSGLRPILWRPYATNDDVVASLVEGVTATLLSPIQFESSDVVNQMQVKYALRVDTGEYLLDVAVGPEGVSLGSSVTTNVYATSSYQLYGLKQGKMETPVVYDKATATRIAADQVRARAFRRRTVSVSVGWRMGWLELGDLVELTAPSYYLESQLCTITGISRSTSDVVLTLLIDAVPLI